RPPPSCPRLRISAAPSLRPLRGIPSTRCHAAAGDPAPAPSQAPGGARAALVRVGEALSLGFPLWVASACALALWRPASFLWVTPTAQMVGLSFTMLGMGMTLTLDDLRTALLMPKELAAGFLLQYTGDAPVRISHQQAIEPAIPLCCWTHFGFLLPWRHCKQHCYLLSKGKCCSFGADDSSKHFCCSVHDSSFDIQTGRAIRRSRPYGTVRVDISGCPSACSFGCST
uniref:Uncharacterized protein n=1 Tax=Aegilops tauschii subsp. strangulata TaxID=200361 RepID=A0A452ZUY6_AEGTS